MTRGFADLGFARVDTDRAERCGRAEVVFCQGKTPEQAAAITAEIHGRCGYALATRADAAHYAAIRERLAGAVYHELARCVTAGSAAPAGNRTISVVSAGTADLPVAEEAAVTLETFGWRVERCWDVGVAGLHRLLAEIDNIRRCDVLIVAAGMEGALPSVVSGLVDMPVIAVPTSVGYGTSFGGLAALLGMLNSCSSKVTVVNIDNGFGAACAADAILRLVERAGAGGKARE
jgi:NCAIR mutase (PurE)-related protein